MAATPESSSASALSELFARAADCLSARPAPRFPTMSPRLLQSLEYASEPDTADLRANRTALLRAAAQFSRVFQLSAPEAPGLVFFGGEVDPSTIAPDHAQAPLTGVGGMGLSMRTAFESCIGEGVEYLSQFEAGDEALVASSAGEMLQAAKGEGRRFLESILPGTAGAADASFDCLVATGLLERLDDAAAGRDLPAPRSRPIEDDAPVLAQHGMCRGPQQGRRRAAWPVRAGRARRRRPLVAGRDARPAACARRPGRRAKPPRCWPQLREATRAAARGCSISRRIWASPRSRRSRAARTARASPSGWVRARPWPAPPGARSWSCARASWPTPWWPPSRARAGRSRLNARDRDHIARATRIDADTCALLHPLGHAGSARSLSVAEDAVPRSAGSQRGLPSGHRDVRARSHAAAICRAGRPCGRARPADRALAAGEPPAATRDRGDRGRPPAHRRRGAVLAADSRAKACPCRAMGVIPARKKRRHWPRRASPKRQPDGGLRTGKPRQLMEGPPS